MDDTTDQFGVLAVREGVPAAEEFVAVEAKFRYQAELFIDREHARPALVLLGRNGALPSRFLLVLQIASTKEDAAFPSNFRVAARSVHNEGHGIGPEFLGAYLPDPSAALLAKSRMLRSKKVEPSRLTSLSSALPPGFTSLGAKK
ncbi:MAG: hypothetical protein U0Q16_15815 [Bryobacteraceae bacterium]